LNKNHSDLQESHKDKKEDEIPQGEKDQLADLDKKINETKNKKEQIWSEFAKGNEVVHQLIDLALLQNNMLKGESLNNFVRRSIDLIK
jgi:molecular chaperone HtpG